MLSTATLQKVTKKISKKVNKFLGQLSEMTQAQRETYGIKIEDYYELLEEIRVSKDFKICSIAIDMLLVSLAPNLA